MKITSAVFEQEFNKLNPDQQKAVTTLDGPVLVVAGPGTGKTQVLTMRIAYILLQEEIKPQNILALTFTESGVAAMKQRLIHLIGTTGYYVPIQTFHAFCNNVILEFPEKFSYRTSDFTNLTDIERYKIIRNIIDQLPLTHLRNFRETYFYVRAIVSTIQDLKKEGVAPDDFDRIVAAYEEQIRNDPTLLNKRDGSQGERYHKEMKKLEKNQELALVYHAYQRELSARGRYDYEDMIMFVVQKLKTDEELLRELQERYHHFLVDEYQDTNSAQNFVVYQLAHFFENPNLFVVGDDDQSIYRFQGASLENMLYLNDKFENITTVVLHTNYRSSQQIIDASTSVIEHNTDRITNPLYGFTVDKTFVAAKKAAGEPVSVAAFSSGDIENYFLVKKIQELLEQGVRPQDIAVIYRNNQDALDIINIFHRTQVPWVMEGGFNILRDNEVLKILELLRVIADPDQEDILFRVLHHEALGLLPLDVMKISRATYHHKRGNKNMLDLLLDEKKLKEAGIQEAGKLIAVAGKILAFQKEAKTTMVLGLTERILREFGILELYLTRNNLRTINRINSFFTFIKKESYLNHKLTLPELLADLSMMEQERIILPEQPVEILEDGVRLMTAHKSKGLEFEYVFLVKCIDGKWGNPRKSDPLTLPPNILSEQKYDQIPENEDERRLFYVALTRAKRKVFISYAHHYPLLDKTAAIPAAFIGEIDPALVQKEDTSVWEEKAQAALTALWQPATASPERETQEFLHSLVKNYRINPIAMNTYLTCPRLFQYDHLVRVPQTKSKLQQYGTAVHAALEMFFTELKKAIQKTRPVPTKEELLQWYREYLEKELLSDEDFQESRQEGERVLALYYDFYQDRFVVPLYVERDYNRIPLYFEGIPLAGKIDKIEAEAVSGQSGQAARVVDYKTGRPRSLNEIKGLTKTGDKGYFYQLQFYKLLIELDRDINRNVLSGMLDFVYPEKDGRDFRQTEVEFTGEEFEEFKKILKAVYQKIQDLEFPKTTNLRICEDCRYRKICWKDTLF